MTKYKSRIGLEIWAPVGLLLSFIGYKLLAANAWPGILIVIAVAVMIVAVVTKTTYTITGNNLIIKCWVLTYHEIDIRSIHRIRKTFNPISSPAASYLGRLELHYNNGNSIIISPARKKAFIDNLVSINKGILAKEAF